MLLEQITCYPQLKLIANLDLYIQSEYRRPRPNNPRPPPRPPTPPPQPDP